ncbi:hypothetical protein HK099_001015 [Clydaea vesicula]|uniref:P-loop containing nucleoside triphosphate hydrolase protein n=1 Tax=Clydaea vesicula TaxID=447962 RepID=A0AAD5TUD1_9FUNG|nr:hypothetical protein HK099_001015 [Clydaea vesicula]
MVMGKTLDAATAYTAYSLLDRLTMDLGEIPDIIAYVLEVKIAGDRIISFLKEPELEKYSIESPEIVQALSDASNTFVGEPKVGFGNARFMYHGSPVENDESKEDDNASTKSGSRGNAAFVLRDIDVEFPIGKLTTICGATGAGKSTLIQALFGELNRLHGEVHLPDPRHHAFAEVNPLSGLVPTGVAYVAQSAWMLNSTIRDNILFGQPYEEKRYYQVLEACALKKDLESLEAGDMTEIGEKGINISGGQKQRISIARAAYSPYSFVVLDDPLSAVDAPTARHILNSCILGPIMKGRTIVLVSHGVGLVLPKSDYVVVLRNGTITAKGTPLELSMGDHLQGIVSDEILSRGSDWLFEAKQENLNDKDRVEETTEENTERKLTGKLVQDEEKSEGAVKLQVYYSYLKSAGGIKFGLLFLCSILLKFAANMAHSWWLKVWSDAGAAANPPVCNVPSNTSPLTPLAATTPVHSGNPKEFDLMYYVLYYALFATSTLIAANLKTCLYIFGQIRAAKIVHSRLLETVLGAPLRFFEITPVGRILNRFSKDIKTVDANVMVMANNFLTLFGEVVQILIVISFFNYTFVILIIPVMVIYFFIANQYLNVSRELKRFEAITRSPVYSQFSESLTGVSTIRGYGHEKRFTKNMLRSVDKNHRTFFYLWAAVRWLSVRTEMISSLVVLAAGCAMLYNNVEASTAGFCLSYALEFNWKLFFTIRSHAELEMGMNAVERIDEYTVLEQEAPAVIDTYRPAPDWPSAGVVTVKNLSIRYAPELPEVLKNLSFQSKRFEKIGVVGRTGAGKSTLSLAFFRIVPFAGGSIDIDGMDISKLGLKDLRSKLTIIPQDPVLFTGTLRSNLDPVGKHDDVEIWSVLKRVHFFESLQDDEEFEPVASSSVSIASSCSRTSVYSSNLSAKQSSNLESKVTENGNNYSHGQRQLLCLARALLRRSKVIILDEATASVDNTTDAKIQETIREEFKENTLFCIAHRLRTVVDYDRILVLDQGQVAEFDTPLALIEKNGIFRSMCEESGEFNELFNIAKNSAK